MTTFDLHDALLPQNPEALAIQDLGGLFRLHLKKKMTALASICFTEIDQAFVIWGLVTLAIFSLAQFSTLAWTTQAIIAAPLTGIAIGLTSGITWTLASDEKLRWVVLLWAGLMAGGVGITAYGVFEGVVFILTNLCPIWLALCALGYGLMSVGMRSHAFTAASLVHSVAIIAMPFQAHWQLMDTGLVIAYTLFLFSVIPWDMQASETDNPC